MVFDPGKYPDPPDMWTDALRGVKQTATANPQPPVPVNVDGLAKQYEWIGLDPAEARDVPERPWAQRS